MAEREAVVDFSVPYYDMIGTIIMMKLPNVPTSLFKFLSVLDDTVWGCIVAAYFVTRYLVYFKEQQGLFRPVSVRFGFSELDKWF